MKSLIRIAVVTLLLLVLASCGGDDEAVVEEAAPPPSKAVTDGDSDGGSVAEPAKDEDDSKIEEMAESTGDEDTSGHEEESSDSNDPHEMDEDVAVDSNEVDDLEAGHDEDSADDEKWAAKWWQWAYSLPADDAHPLIADGEMDCRPGQKGKVWFLGGNFAGSKANRTCEVPAGKALFFPIVNIICSEWTGDADALGCAESPGVPPGAEFIMNPLSLKIDGKPVRGLNDFLVVSEETFTLGPVPDPAVWGAPPGEATEGATRGYYVLIQPFYDGEHEIEFVGEIIVTDSLIDPDDDFDYYYKSEISYKLEVDDDFGEDDGGEAD